MKDGTAISDHMGKWSDVFAHKEFKLYVLGREVTRRHTAVSQMLAAARTRPVPCDWVYVNNFEAPHKPRTMKLPTGSDSALKLAMEGSQV